MGSILNDVKASLGITEDYVAFDEILIPLINTTFVSLWQLGVGKDQTKPFKIEDDSTEWSEFIDDGELESCKTYMSDQVKMLFDPPTSSIAMDALKDRTNEIEWRMVIANDFYGLSQEGG